jgi:hypothetical protein
MTAYVEIICYNGRYYPVVETSTRDGKPAWYKIIMPSGPALVPASLCYKIMPEEENKQ